MEVSEVLRVTAFLNILSGVLNIY